MISEQQNEDPLFCLTFSSYSSDKLVEIATKVSDDCKTVSGNDDDDIFEFFAQLPETEIVHKISVSPVFNRELVVHNNQNDETEKREEDVSAINLVPLRDLFLEKRGHSSPTSSSEADEDSESLSPGSYCFWRPKLSGSSPSTCKKSKSTGSATSKRFRIRDLLRRSNSEGKESFVFVTPKNQSKTKTETIEKIGSQKLRRHSGENAGNKLKAVASPSSPGHELFYIQKRWNREGDKRKSYLPYRRDILGFFVGLGRVN